MIQYNGTDPVIKNIHDNLNKIEWILKNKRPIPESTDPTKRDVMDLINEMMGMKGNSPFRMGL